MKDQVFICKEAILESNNKLYNYGFDYLEAFIQFQLEEESVVNCQGGIGGGAYGPKPIQAVFSYEIPGLNHTPCHHYHCSLLL